MAVVVYSSILQYLEVSFLVPVLDIKRHFDLNTTHTSPLEPKPGHQSLIYVLQKQRKNRKFSIDSEIIQYFVCLTFPNFRIHTLQILWLQEAREGCKVDEAEEVKLYAMFIEKMDSSMSQISHVTLVWYEYVGARSVRFSQIEKFLVRIQIFSMGIDNHESRLNKDPNSPSGDLGNR